MKNTIKIITILIFAFNLQAQNIPNFDYKNPKEYEIGGITVTGIQYIEENVVVLLSGLSVGNKITVPGDEISKAINNLWKQGLFGNITINVTNVQRNYIFLNIHLEEKPRLTKFSIKGIGKSESKTISEKLKISRNDVITDNIIMTSEKQIFDYFVNKGFLNTTVKTIFTPDTTGRNNVIVDFVVDKKERVRIKEIVIDGNDVITDNKIRRKLKNTKQKNLFRVWKTSKFISKDFQDDKKKIVKLYNEKGFKDFQLIRDSICNINENHIGLYMHINEGKQYFFRNINWVGNTKYSNKKLSEILGIKYGDVYNQTLLETNLYMNMHGADIHSLYMDDGYLFFSATPVEARVENDSIDIDIIIHEGQQAYIRKVTIKGNTRTHDRVILREIRTKPGQLFNRSDIIRTQRELAQLRYFDQEKLNVNMNPNPEDGTVDIEYIVEETSTDQLELSGGWGLGRIVGTLGVSFNNFSLGDVFKRSAWSPIPSGSGQRLSLRVQSNGIYFQSYNMSFTEPWLGGKRPNSLTLGAYYSVQTNGISAKKDSTYTEYGQLLQRQHIKITGITAGLGRRLKWPDDYFILYQGLTYQHYDVKDFYSAFAFGSGNSNNLNYSITFSRNSIDAPIYPRSGSEISLTAQLTPPYSLINQKDFSEAADKEKFKWLEYHKWKFNTTFYSKLAGNLVLTTRTRFGFLGLYNQDIGLSPFERFYVGGDGLSGFSLDGRELIGMRGYGNNTLTPKNPQGHFIGGTIFTKYTMELRYPLSLNPMASIYMLCFAEAGNAWLGTDQFNPFDVKRSFGVGVRLFMPMFGTLGLDYGYGVDEVPGIPGANKGQFHFSINHSID